MRRFLLTILVAFGCGTTATRPEGPADPLPNAADRSGTDSTGTGSDDAGVEHAEGSPNPCPRTFRPADADRFVVVAHPFTASGEKGKDYEVLKLTSDGALTRTPTTFSMGMALDGEIAFTPDGRIGVVAQNDGSVGVFELSADGASVRVVHPSFRSGFYAKHVAIDASGTRVVIVDSQVAKNGGGLYEARIGCDGSLTGERKLTSAGGIGALGVFHGRPERFLTSGGASFGTTEGDAHVFDLGPGGVVPVASTDVFGEVTIVSSIAMSQDDQVGVLARSNAIIGPTEVGVVTFRGGVLEKGPPLPIVAPTVLLASPFGNAFFVSTVDPDSFHLLRYDSANTTSPVSDEGELPNQFGKPTLPGAATHITRGKLKGRILVAELSSIRSLQFAPDGGISAVAKLTFPSGMENTLGAIGVTP